MNPEPVQETEDEGGYWESEAIENEAVAEWWADQPESSRVRQS